MKTDLSAVRKSYDKHALTSEMLPSGPAELLARWLNDAREVNPDEFNAMCLSTVGLDGQPDARMVLAKDIEEESIHFYTNYRSNKALQMEQNPAVALTFYWPELERQVRVQGRVEKLPSAVSDAYFASRPRESQIGAWTSDQSQPLNPGTSLEDRAEEESKRFADVETITRPPHWGGFAVRMDAIEFWQGRPSRLHHRWRYERAANGWTHRALQP